MKAAPASRSLRRRKVRRSISRPGALLDEKPGTLPLASVTGFGLSCDGYQTDIT